MAANQDARPFVDLRKDAEEFQEKFNEDIKDCLNLLDAKITALICDPDSLGDKTKNIKQNASMEFAKAKYDIFISVKSLINCKEREWLTYISEMKKLFIENVEVFLAGTKLEVKLPQSEYISSLGPRKSPGNRKSISSVTNSVLNNIAKNIPVLSSPLRNKQTTDEDISDVVNDIQSNRSGRLSAKFNIAPGTSATIQLSEDMETSDNWEQESRTAGDKVQFNRRGRLSVKLNNPPSVASSLNQKGNTGSSDSSENEARSDEGNIYLQRRGRQSATSIKLSKSTKQVYGRTNASEVDIYEVGQESDDAEMMDTAEADFGKQEKTAGALQIQKDISVSRPARGRRNKQSVQTGKLDNAADSSHSKKLPGRSLKSKQAENNFSLETEEPESVETTVIQAKGRKGKGRTKNTVDNSLENIITKNTNGQDDEEPTVTVTVRGRRARSAAPKGSDNIVSENNITKDINAEDDEEPTVEVTVRGRRARSAAPKGSDNNVSDKSVPARKPARGRKSVKVVDETPELVSSSQKNNSASSDEHSEPDVVLSVARPAKPSSRRKTMLPNLKEMPGSDIIPGNPTRSSSKRKTIGGRAEIECAAPTKRLKISSRKNVSSIQEEEEDDANDNLLESDDNYSEWMPLKNVDGKIPTLPAVYEVKVWRAKKTAYIGSCESLRQKLTLYKLRQNSGHKHLDKFVERNFNDIQVRFEVVPSVADAKNAEKDRVKRFVGQYKTTPAYN